MITRLVQRRESNDKIERLLVAVIMFNGSEDSFESTRYQIELSEDHHIDRCDTLQLTVLSAKQ